MNQMTETTLWRGDCLITHENNEGAVFVHLDFRDLRGRKFRDLRALVPGHPQHKVLNWYDVFSSVTHALDKYFDAGWIAAYGEGDEYMLWFELIEHVRVETFVQRLQEYLEEHAEIVVHTA